MDYLITLKLLSLVFAIWLTEINILKVCYTKEDVPYLNFLVQSLSITIFVALQFNLFN